MLDAIFHATRASGSTLQWRHIGTHITALFDKFSPPSLNRAIVLTSPYVPRFSGLATEHGIVRWAAAASAVPDSEEVRQCVVNTLLRIADNDSLRSHVPVDIWAWLKKRPSLPPMCRGRSNGSWHTTVHHVRGLGDIEILVSYLLVVWSEWDSLYSVGVDEMEISIRMEFGGVGMWCHRDGLIKHLDLIQGQLDRGLEYFREHKPRTDESDIRWRKEQYGHLKNVLLEVDKREMETLTRTSPRLTLLISSLILVRVFRISCDLYLCSPPSMSIICIWNSRHRSRALVLQWLTLFLQLHHISFLRPLFIFVDHHAVHFGCTQDCCCDFMALPVVSLLCLFFTLEYLPSFFYGHIPLPTNHAHIL